MVLGYSRLIWARFAYRQTLLACHKSAFEAIGGVPREILYDRMKTAVIGEDEDGKVLYNRSLADLAAHYNFLPKACRPYRPQTKGKVERPFRYIREDFFLGSCFRNLDDLNRQLAHWLATVANPRVHATTGRVVNEAFADEKPLLQMLPLIPFGSVIKLERRISCEGMVSVACNYYSVPDATRKKKDHPHAVPLTKTAAGVLASLRRYDVNAFVFTTTGGKSASSNFYKVKQEADRLSGVTGWTLHNLRRTVRSKLAELGVSRDVARKVLNHEDGKVDRIYNRHEYQAEKREALEKWETRLMTLMEEKSPILKS